MSDVAPGVIRLRGYPVEQLVGRASLVEKVWLMLRGDLPTAAQADLLEHALVAAVDHGSQAPSIAAARIRRPHQGTAATAAARRPHRRTPA